MRRNISLQKSEYRAALLGILPALIIFGLFMLYPQIVNLKYSLTDFDGLHRDAQFIGLNNFVQMFKDKAVLKAYANTIIFAVVSIVIGTVLQFLIALILYRGIKGANFFKGLFYIPSMISLVILSVIWGQILKYTGQLNTAFSLLGAEQLVRDWLGSTDTALWSIIAINIWQYTGYGTIIFLAGLNSIPNELWESAELDGATGFKRLWFITIPLMMYSFTISLFMGLTGGLKIFDLPFILTQGGPRNATLTVAMNIYKNAFGQNRFGYAAGIALIFTLFVGVITFIQLRVTRKREVEY